MHEIAQCPPEDAAAFQDVTRHKYFDTNNLWFHLPTLKKTLVERDYVLDLPMIHNAKAVDPRDPGTPVYQLETALNDNPQGIVPNSERQLGQIVINLDPAYYKLIAEMAARFPHGVQRMNG